MLIFVHAEAEAEVEAENSSAEAEIIAKRRKLADQGQKITKLKQDSAVRREKNMQ
jgi:hypothetical protein